MNKQVFLAQVRNYLVGALRKPQVTSIELRRTLTPFSWHVWAEFEDGTSGKFLVEDRKGELVAREVSR